RGDDHVNNTPRQINMLLALGAQVPQYAHLSMILGDDGQKLSKRHGAVSVMQYHEDGYLREAVLNYLARLGWSHGDDEVFDMAQFCQWFDLDHITPSAAQFNTEKLNWLNAHYIKTLPLARIADEVKPRLLALGITEAAVPDLLAVLNLYRERCNNLNQLAREIAFFYQTPSISEADATKHILPETADYIESFLQKTQDGDWTADSLHDALNQVVAEQQIKFPKLAMPLRVALIGIAQSPSIDQVMAILGKETCLQRIRALFPKK
ncbi:MAG TPA: glutamate--tRNA ligase family protein, partial [Methylophilus sp.]